MKDEPSYHLIRLRVIDRAGVITTVAAALASRGVNIEAFAACGVGGSEAEENGRFLIIIEAEADYARVLTNLLSCLEVVQEVDNPAPLQDADLRLWRQRFQEIQR